MYLRDAAEHYGLTLNRKGGESTGYILKSGNQTIATIHVAGGGDRSSWTYIRGLTVDSVWIDEATVCDEQFIKVAEERISFDGGVIILTQNADAPTHWIKTEWIDPEHDSTALLTAQFGDNFYYSQEQLEHQLAQNQDTAYWQRAFGNQWAGNEGLVYPIPNFAIVEPKFPTSGKPVGDVFLDPGAGSITAAILVQRMPNGEFWIVDEYYHDSG